MLSLERLEDSAWTVLLVVPYGTVELALFLLLVFCGGVPCVRHFGSPKMICICSYVMEDD